VKDFDLDDLFESDEPQATVKPSPAVQAKPVVVSDISSPVYIQRTASKGIGFIAFFASVFAAMMLGFSLGYYLPQRGGESVDPDVDPVSGAYVAIFYQDTDIQKYSSSQREFLNSVNTANWLEEHKVNWKKIDVDDSVDRLEPPFPIMAEKHRSKEPWIVIAAGKKFASEPIESNEQAMKLLQKWVK